MAKARATSAIDVLEEDHDYVKSLSTGRPTRLCPDPSPARVITHSFHGDAARELEEVFYESRVAGLGTSLLDGCCTW